MKNIKMAVITGGPCSGKTSFLGMLQKEFDEKFPDWHLMIIPETATELIINGIKPFNNCLSLLNFQKYVLEMQIAKEELYLKAANDVPKDNILIVCDRGLCDNIAYCDNKECSNEEMFSKLLLPHNKTLSNARDRYDVIIHLVTAAKGTNAYTTANNSARRETAKEACATDSKTLLAWMGHPNLKIIDNSTDFQEKLNRAMSEIYYLIGLNGTIEYHKKLLVKIPDINKLKYNKKITIIQNYLYSDDDNIEKRIRQRRDGESSSFYYTEKNKVKENDNGRLKSERKIDEREYILLLSQVNPEYHQITKDRYCFIYNNQYMSLDIFNFDKEQALLEVSFEKRDTNIEIPNFIEIIKDVTFDNNYKNVEISKNLSL